MPLIRSSNNLIDYPGEPAAEIDFTGLRDDLCSLDVAARRAAVRRAGRSGAMELLAGRLEAEDDHGVRELILTTLVRKGGVAAARSILGLLRSDDAGLRNAVIETLQEMGEAITPLIEELLADPDSDVRIFAMNILISLNSPRVPDIALKVIANDPHVNVCAAAVDVLAEAGRPEMADALRDVAKRFPDQPFLAYSVRAALKRIG
ncbi:MAG: HEAT repeat domain-containing protein [Roseiarcus sp.]